MSKLQSKVLMIDDEKEILELINTVLTREGIDRVITASTARDGLAKFHQEQPDLVILDIMLPDGEGYDICRQIRETSHVPIIFLSAKGEESDKIVGLAIGGDDYITKPFSPKEVAYRVKAQLRRISYLQSTQADPVIKKGPFELNEQQAELTKNGAIIELTPKELLLMTYFLQHPNRVISKETLYQTVWGEDFFGSDNTVMVHIRRLREKIEDSPSTPEFLVTVKGLGYKFVVKDA
ncbi:response regulator transcription factor [Bacillus safensis]|uniref:response regulator transcription factor n=1 Tax=Bacillus safensis TaxID=561879 RepID=UPI00227E6379|nr:response regulator transcription factor [Bacillus safensis]MCY7710086.1 response regulator transcription factor [Bacillus safensis]MCY7729606.1 response regulator transcription factor [Bacillus safensis]MCY7736845.1 response regulator transcription factor [Bacillus safensis]MED0884188.1 response regulator transcription factor [Bacillus safensis]MED0916855.1 response regulator transcription factor [Bacillus safensis]